MKNFFYPIFFSVRIVFAANGSLSIMQGMTSSDSIQLAVLIGHANQWNYVLKNETGEYLPTKTDRKSIYPKNEWEVEKPTFSNLPSGTYRLEVLNGSQIIDSRTVKTLDLKKENPRIAFISCTADFFYSQQKAMWTRVFETKPDLIFLTGDNVYAGIASPIKPEEIWRRYAETRRILKAFHQLELIPMLAVWDDHDYGGDNLDSTYAYKFASLEVFKSFYAQSDVEDAWHTGPGASHHLDAFGFDFFLLDGRFFKSPKSIPLDLRTLWGVEQTLWLKSRLAVSDNPAWIINGGQVFSVDATNENLEHDQPTAFADFVNFGKLLPRTLLFASGDVHFSEVNEIPEEFLGYTTWEFTSSSLHSIRAPFSEMPKNARRLEGVYKDNFLFVDIARQNGNLKLHTESIGKDEVYFTLDRTIEERRSFTDFFARLKLPMSIRSLGNSL